jgi:hypothetical protein
VEHLRWQWTLANGGNVTAVIDAARGIEIVQQEARVLAEAPRGTRPEGHTVLISPKLNVDGSERPPVEAIVTFDPTRPICILRVDGHDVAPLSWPIRAKPAPPPPTRPSAIPFMLALAVATVLAIGWFYLRSSAGAGGSPLGRLRGTHRSNNGLFIAHFPEELDAKPAVLPNGVGGVLLVDKPKTSAIVLGATPSDPWTPHDAWALQQRLHDEALANLPKGKARFEESSRSEEICVGEHGAVVTGYLTEKSVRRAIVWSCAFERDGAGYIALYMLVEPAPSDGAARLRAIVDATELTHLAERGGAPEVPSAAVK